MLLRYLLIYTLMMSTCALATNNPSTSSVCKIPPATNSSRVILQHGVRTRYGVEQLNGLHMNVGFYSPRFLPDDTLRLCSKTLLVDLSKYLNFTFTLHIRHTTQDELTAMKNGSLDLDISMFIRTRHRAHSMQFLRPLIDSYYVVIIKRPREKITMFNILDPFDTYIWLCMVAYSLITAATMTAIERMSQRSNGLQENEETAQGIFYHLGYMFGSFLQQGGVSLPLHLPSRILLSIWWFFALSICALYTGNLFSFLTVKPTIQYPFRTLNEFAHHPTIIPTAVEGWSILDEMQRQPSESDLGKMWQKMSGDRRAVVSNIGAAIELVVTRNYGFIKNVIGAEEIFRADYESTGTCRLAIAPLKIPANRRSWIVPLNSTHAHAINIGLQSYMESGLFELLRKRILSHGIPKCSQEMGTGIHAQSLDLETMYGIMLVLAIGLPISLAFFLLEVIIVKWKRNAERLCCTGRS
ncbi:PREDICTED: glutamate receptor ionotropic, delta-1-like [Priapulus caudatus]|uniref:Glutamate receptor ionotropic, delta-1-like n=1 Tax=Priapulus caudatus TaxID=37621 RepID=A0ABM1DYP1_PRICU|nr:PREDICTED: glutamate receptor ionotropic, delta-1-like [Priapulus caudatus]